MSCLQACVLCTHLNICTLFLHRAPSSVCNFVSIGAATAAADAASTDDDLRSVRFCRARLQAFFLSLLPERFTCAHSGEFKSDAATNLELFGQERERERNVDARVHLVALHWPAYTLHTHCTQSQQVSARCSSLNAARKKFANLPVVSVRFFRSSKQQQQQFDLKQQQQQHFKRPNE